MISAVNIIYNCYFLDSDGDKENRKNGIGENE